MNQKYFCDSKPIQRAGTCCRQKIKSKDLALPDFVGIYIFTACKRSLRRLCFCTCLSFYPRGGCLDLDPGGGWGSGWGVSRPHNQGRLGVWLRVGSAQAHIRGSFPGPHPGSPGPYWGVERVSRPGQAGGSVQALGEVGCFPTCSEADPPPPADGYCCGRYASYWNAFLLSLVNELLCLMDCCDFC